MRVFDIGQIFVIRDDRDGVRGSLEIMLPFQEGKNDGKEFSVVDVIILFYKREGFREVGTGVRVAIGVLLHENSSHSKERCVSHEEKGFGCIGDGEDRSSGEELSEGVECALLKRTLGPGLVFFGEGGEGSDNV